MFCWRRALVMRPCLRDASVGLCHSRYPQMLVRAPADRAWRRRGWLVMLDARKRGTDKEVAPFYSLGRSSVLASLFLAVSSRFYFHYHLSNFYFCAVGPALLGMNPTTVGEVSRAFFRRSKVAVARFSDSPVLKDACQKKRYLIQKSLLRSTGSLLSRIV